jgi:two-component system sensor histidine kinase/response regulator
VDYITKPIHAEEVLVRINTHLALQNLQKRLQEQNQQLQQEILERQAALREREKAEQTLRIFLHSVSHDLRNPVTGMLMVLKNVLSRQWSVVSEWESTTTDNAQEVIPLRAILERMETSCDRQLNLINSLVETHASEVWGVPLECQPLLLHTLTQKLVAEWEPMLTKHQATLKHLVPADLPPSWADPNQLWRVFENLIANALKHNPPGVTLTLSAEVVTIDSLDLGNQDNSQSKIQNLKSKIMLRCCVADDGVGMTSEQCANLFELYTRGAATRRTMGLGLGLYLCRQIITAHGGEIEVISSPHAGATFCFTLPVSASPIA